MQAVADQHEIESSACIRVARVIGPTCPVCGSSGTRSSVDVSAQQASSDGHDSAVKDRLWSDMTAVRTVAVAEIVTAVVPANVTQPCDRTQAITSPANGKSCRPVSAPLVNVNSDSLGKETAVTKHRVELTHPIASG